MGNLFYAGDMYGSFLLHILSVMALPIPAVQVPIGGLTSEADTAHIVEQCKVTVLLSTATSLIRLATFAENRNQPFTGIRRIMFGGEPLFPDQEKILHRAFPNATIKSCVYGSIDAGVISTATIDADTRIFQAINEAVVVEIVSSEDRRTVIEEEHVPGLLIATSLIRRLSPVLRYPVGDRAEWVDRRAGVFRFLGRDSQAVRLGPVSIDMVDLRHIVFRALGETPVQAVQAVLSRHQGKDKLQLLIAGEPPDRASAAEAVRDLLYIERPMFKQHVDLGIVGPLMTRFVQASELSLASRSHKMLEIVETRFEHEAGNGGR